MIHRALIVGTFLTGLVFAPGVRAQAVCTSDPQANQGTNGVLYDQRSVEHALVAEQTFKAATAALRSVKSAPGDALLPDAPLPKSRRKLPPAIILDVDETVLDNSPAQAFLVKTQAAYCAANWDRWVASRQATAVPGAIAFTQAAERAGIKVFYVTNRSCPPGTGAGRPCTAKTDTMAVMERLGFARAKDPAAFLLNGEQADWTSDKSTRRALIARNFGVVMMLGDQLTDFVSPDTAKKIWTELQTPIVSAAVASPPEASGAYARYRDLVGRRWFVLPNAQYGFFLNRFTTPALRTEALQAASIGPAPQTSIDPAQKITP
jgi:5'-nucleotidase (lipoprotein e(P4) family)